MTIGSPGPNITRPASLPPMTRKVPSGAAGSVIGAQARAWSATVMAGEGACARSVRATRNVMGLSFRSFLAGSARRRRLDFRDAFLRRFEPLALVELADDALVVHQRFGRSVQPHQRFAEIEIHVVAPRVLGIVLQQRRETPHDAGIPLEPEVLLGDTGVPVGEPVLGIAQALLRLGVQLRGFLVRELVDEVLEFLDRVARLALV